MNVNKELHKLVDTDLKQKCKEQYGWEDPNPSLPWWMTYQGPFPRGMGDTILSLVSQ
jgi:hypothetical protein